MQTQLSREEDGGFGAQPFVARRIDAAKLARPRIILQTSQRSTTETERENDGAAPSIYATVPVLLLGVFVANGDTSLVLATSSSIASSFGDLGGAGWLITSYALGMCASQPIYGKLSDVYGRKSMLLLAYTTFTIGCLICGVGSTLWQVILGRVISGIGGAGMTSLVSILITDMMPLRQVAAWRSYVNVAATTGRSLGGPVGGFLADTIGWRWSFLGQCPVILLAIILVLWRIPSLPRFAKPTKDSAVKKTSTSKLARVDFLGAALLASSITAFLLFLDLGGKSFPWNSLATYILGSASIALCSGFALVEMFWASEPVFPLRLLANRDVVTSYLIAALQVSAQLGVMFSIPLYFQVTANASVTAAGARLVPAVVGNAIGGLLTGYAIRVTGRYKLLTIMGPTCSGVGFILLILKWHGQTSLAELMYIIPGGFGTGVSQSTTFIQLTAGVEASDMAVAGTGLYLSQNIGMVAGLSVMTAVLQGTLRPALARGLHGVPHKRKVIEDSISNIQYVQSLQGNVKEVVLNAYVQSLAYTHAVSLVCSLLALITAFVIQEHKL